MKTFVEYPESLKVEQVMEPETDDVEVISEEQYHLVAVISHQGNTITSGHYTVCALRSGEWFYLDDAQVSKISSLTARNQEAYVLMYERDTTKKSNAATTTSHSHPNQSSFRVFDSYPPNFYIDYPSTSYSLPKICCTEKSEEKLVYRPITESQVNEAKLKAYEDHTFPNHLRLKGYSSSDLLSLLPGTWLNNFVINNYMWLLEKKCKALGNNVRTINSDVFQTMKTPSMEIFNRNKYQTLYSDILSCDVILGAVNFGNHWCLVAIFPQLRMMVYLDSLYHGAHAKESFQRMQNFLQCSQRISKAQDSSLDWKEWLFYNLPSRYLSQQTNSDDCGVFVSKWAQHIALGFPLDFTQANIESFRYSMILEIRAGEPRLEIELPSLESQFKNETATHEEHVNFCTSEERSKRKEVTSLKRQLSSHSLEDFVDSDDDFQQTKKVKSSNTKDFSAVSPSSNTQTKKTHSTTHDHCYATSKPRVQQSDLPLHVRIILPPNYTYKLQEYEDQEKEYFTGAPKEAFKAVFSICNVTSAEQVKTWVSELASTSNIKYVTQGGYRRKGVKVLLSKWYICQCQRKKLTKKQQEAKNRTLKKRQVKLGTNSQNVDAELHLLSTARDKKTGCPSKMSIKLLPINAIDNVCHVQLWWTHNHSIDCFHIQTFGQILPATTETFHDYFASGMSAAEAFHHHESTLMNDPSTMTLLADRRHCPSATDVRRMFGKWRIETKGAPDGVDMFQELEDVVNDYNKRHSRDGGKCAVQRYEKTACTERPLILAIVTPLMARVHSLPQAGEMVFLDASASIDRHNNPVFFLCTHHPSGALPLCVWVTSDNSQQTVTSCLETAKGLFPDGAFGGRGVQEGPKICLTDDDSSQRAALRTTWSSTKLLLCVFHFLQSTWRWLWDSKNKIELSDRKRLMKLIQKLVFAENELELNAVFSELKDDQAAKKYKHFVNYTKNSMLRKSEWAICLRKRLLTRGNNTDNYTESMIFIFKCIILRRIRAYNLVELFKFIVEDLDRYFQRKLLALAFGKPQNLHIASRCFGKKASTVDLATITQDSGEPFKFYVPSRKEKGTIYVVNSSIGMCSCPAGENGNSCPHQAAVALKYGISNSNFIPTNHIDKYKLAVLAIGEHPDLCAEKFADIHQKKFDSTKTAITEPVVVNEIPKYVPLNDEPENVDDEHTDKPETSLEDVIKLHKEVSSDIEFWLRSGSPNFIKCYSKYLETYKKIVNKARGQSPINSLSSGYVSFGRNTNCKMLPILHNANKRIRVQPTAISRRRSGIKSSLAQPAGRKPTLRKKDQCTMPDRKRKKEPNRKRNLSLNINLNKPNAGHTR